MMGFVLLNGFVLVAEAASGVVNGVKKLATVISEAQAKKILQNLK
jgi:hypothetical protein